MANNTLGSSPNATFETITPALAVDWLAAFNTNNRSIKRSYVVRLASDMETGKWIGDNGEAIRFDVNGRLVDGQHRLSACVFAGVSFRSLIIRNIPVNCYDTIGIGAKKSVADFLQPNGYKNAKLLAATVRLIAMNSDGNLGEFKNGDLQPTVARIMETLQQNRSIEESVSWVAGRPAVKQIITPSFAAFLHYAGTTSHGGDAVCLFLDSVGDGLGMCNTDPVYHLRRLLIANRTSRRKADQRYILAIIVKAWNAMAAGRTMQALHFRVDETFPVVAK